MRLFEFEDQIWFPKNLRRWQMDYIRMAIKLLDPYRNLQSPWISEEPPDTRVDLASGAGEPVPELYQRWSPNDRPIQLIRTDLYPSGEGIDFLDLRSDAYPPAHLYTLFNAFHHLDSMDQLQIMARMSVSRTALIAEPLSRNPLTFLGVFVLTGPGNFILSPFVRPFSWPRMFWTYIIPIVPVVTCWDGLISVLRTPRSKDFRELAKMASNDHFIWRAESISFPFGRVNMLVGNRRNAQ